jgi:hypothetical protein
MEVLKNYMNGSWVESKEQQTIECCKPGEPGGTCQKFLSVKIQLDVDESVRWASRSF